MIDGDYDTGGAYWGGGGSEFMWCAFSTAKDSINDEPIMIFLRARSWDEAVKKAEKELAFNAYGTPWSFVK